MAGVKKEERREDRKFVALPPETVQVVADSVGVGNVAPAVAAALSEDASYRVRELAHICSQLLRHSKRKKLTPEDVNRALRLFDAQPIYGHESTSSSGTSGSFVHVRDADVCVEDEGECVDLADVALGEDDKSNNGGGLAVQATWLSLEGKAADQSCLGSSRTFDDFPHQGNLSPALIQYYSAVTSATLGESETLVQMILDDLSCNPKISPLLPFLVSFVRTGIQKYCGNKVLLPRLLALLKALFANKYLNLYPKPYLSHLVTAILSSLKTDRPTSNVKLQQQNGHHDPEVNGSVGDVHDELKVCHVPMAANILKHVLDRWATPVNLLRSQTLKALVAQFKDTSLSFSSHYGALCAMIALGPKVVEDCLLPHLSEYLAFIDSKQAAAIGSGEDERTKRVIELMRGTLMEAARDVVRQHYEDQSSDPAVLELRSRIYSQLYFHFGDSLSYGISARRINRIPHDAAATAATASEEWGTLKIRSIGRRIDNGGGTINATPAKMFSSSDRNKFEMAESSLPTDIFEPMDTSASPEKLFHPDVTPKKLSGEVRASFETADRLHTVSQTAKVIAINATGLTPWTRDRLRLPAFQTHMRMFEPKRAGTARSRATLVVGGRRGDMSEAKKKRRAKDRRPRTVLSLTQ